MIVRDLCWYLSKSKIEVDSFGMTNVQNTIGFWRETCPNLEKHARIKTNNHPNRNTGLDKHSLHIHISLPVPPPTSTAI
uniref:Uncharacterized protein n=1 Tax=Anguilla anguilla TaxID=7936 RepID=A0A0E9W7J1_ANGAN